MPRAQQYSSASNSLATPRKTWGMCHARTTSTIVASGVFHEESVGVSVCLNEGRTPRGKWNQAWKPKKASLPLRSSFRRTRSRRTALVVVGFKTQKRLRNESTKYIFLLVWGPVQTTPGLNKNNKTRFLLLTPSYQ